MESVFATRDEASRAAAKFIAGRLRDRLAAEGDAAIVVSGGSTPVRCFEQLSNAELEWSRIRVVLSDERWLPPAHPDSNERLIRAHLLRGRAAAASLLPVFAGGSSPAERCTELDAAWSVLPHPFACTLLGMGSDGHFASLFPDADNLALGLDPASGRSFLPVTTAASPHARITMTLPALLRTNAVLLLIFGNDKREVCAAAAAGDDSLPAAALFAQRQTPVHVYWAE